MPYIKPERRHIFNDELQLLASRIESTGDLNYCVSALAHLWLERLGKNYENASRARAGLSDADVEFYRTVLAPYEDKKIRENGPVLPLTFANHRI